MKLRNKKTGEIGTLIVDGAYKFVTNFAVEDDEGNRLGEYNSLAELNEEWEDYEEEPKDIFWIDNEGTVCGPGIDYSGTLFEKNKGIGNYFKTKEEAEKVVEKLKAWKRLKDKGLEINDCVVIDDKEIRLYGYYSIAGIEEDLDLLFGGEDDN